MQALPRNDAEVEAATCQTWHAHKRALQTQTGDQKKKSWSWHKNCQKRKGKKEVTKRSFSYRGRPSLTLLHVEDVIKKNMGGEKLTNKQKHVHGYWGRKLFLFPPFSKIFIMISFSPEMTSAQVARVYLKHIKRLLAPTGRDICTTTNSMNI